ncbi:MAG: ABC transporter substrate-binding protein [Ruminococcaceae bacterium]|nr:ABC transporter substrate-binding protein [Oscillospiraceae bacterium]
MKRILLGILIILLLINMGCSNYYVGNGNILPTLDPALSDTEHNNSDNSGDNSSSVTGRDSATVGIVDIDTYFPLDTQNSALRTFFSLIYESLVTLDNMYNVSYCLAKDIYTTDGGITWEIILDTDIKWHNNTYLNADDVIYTIEYIRNNRTTDYVLLQEIEQVIKISDSCIQIRLMQPNSLFVSKLTFPIVPDASKLAVYPCGSGMYRFKEVTNTGSYVFEIYKDYRKRKASIGKLIFTSYTDENALLQSDSDFMIVNNALSTNSIVGGSSTYLLQQNIYCCLVPSLEMSGSDLYTTNIRRAVFNSLNREEIIKHVVSGYAKARYLPIEDKTFFWQNDLTYTEPTDFSVTLENLGYSSPVRIVLCADAHDKELMSVAQICASQLEVHGFEVEIVTYDNEEQLQTIEYSYLLTRIQTENNWEFSPIFAENEILSYNISAIKNAYMKPNETNVVDIDAFKVYMQDQIKILGRNYYENMPFVGLYAKYDALLISNDIHGSQGLMPTSWNPLMGFENLY